MRKPGLGLVTLALLAALGIANDVLAQSSASYRVSAALPLGGDVSTSAGYVVAGCLEPAVAGTGASASFRVDSGCAWGAGLYAGLPDVDSVSGGGTQSTGINQAFSQALQVTVVDPFGDPVAGATVTFVPPASGASCTLSGGGTASTDASGIASVTATANGTTGSYVVSAGVSGLPSVSFALTNGTTPVQLQRFTAE